MRYIMPMICARVAVSTLVLALCASVACTETSKEPETKPKPVSQPRTYTGDTLPHPDTDGPPQKGGTLRIAMDADPPHLNPHLDPLDGWARRITDHVYESLAAPDPHTWKHVPALAESWKISSDKTILTFQLRENIQWHDGEAFDADDVIFTVDKLLEPSSKTGSTRSFLKPLKKYEKTSSHSVRFVLEEPYWNAFNALAELDILPEHVFSKGDFNTHPNNRKPVGTGPYRFDRWRGGESISLVRADDYWGDAPHIDRLLFKSVKDVEARGQLVAEGALDVVERVSPEEWDQLSREASITDNFWRIRHVPDGLQWIGWNMARPMFQDRRVRQAFTLLIDRQAIVDELRYGIDMPAVSWFYPGSREFNPDIEAWPYDPKKAGKLLDQAGWKDSNGNGIRDKDGVEMRFSFIYPDGPKLYPRLFAMMKGQFDQQGIEIEAARLDWPVFTERLRTHSFDACSLVWRIRPRSDPFQIWHSSEAANGANWVSFHNRAADTLLERGRAEFDESKRIDLYHEFSELLHREQPYTLLFYRYNLSLVNKRVGGLYSTPYGLFRYEDLFIKADSAADSP